MYSVCASRKVETNCQIPTQQSEMKNLQEVAKKYHLKKTQAKKAII